MMTPLAAASRFNSSYKRISDIPIGIIINAVEVFDNHMERKPVASMNPKTSRWGCPPITRKIFKAIRLCRFHFSTAVAIIKPPRNSKIIQSIYWPATFGKTISRSEGIKPLRILTVSKSIWFAAGTRRPRMMPSSGNRTMGSSAVAESGIASVIHHIAISNITAAMRVTRGLPGSRSTNSNTRTNASGPSHSPILLRIGVISTCWMAAVMGRPYEVLLVYR